MLRFVLAALTLVALVVPTSSATAQVVDEVAPSSAARGTSTEVLLRGEGLDVLTGVTVSGGGLAVSRFTVDSPEQARFTVGVGDRAALGPRDVTLLGGDGGVLDDALTIAPGALAVLFSTPTDGTRGDAVTLEIGGRNLDTVTRFELGDGITVTDFEIGSPVDATVDIEIDEDAFSGPRTLVAVSDFDRDEQVAAFTVLGGTPTLSSASPAALERASSGTVTLSGVNLDEVTGVRFGSRVVVEGFTVVSPSEATVTVAPRDDATAGARPVVLVTEDGPIETDVTFSVEAGELQLDRLRPDAVPQAANEFVIFEGRNLDGVDTIDLGDGVIIDTIESSFPTSITAIVEVELDATPGPRDVIVSGPNGRAELGGAFVVRELVLSDPRIVVGSPLTFERTSVGARRAAQFQIENAGDIEETLTFGAPNGDADLFTLFDPTTDEPFDTLTLTLAPGEVVTFDAWFEPTSRGRNGAAWPLSVRDGVEVDDMVIEGEGLTADLLVSVDRPLDAGTIATGAREPLPRIDTLLADGVPPRSTVIEDVQLVVLRDGEPVDDPSTAFDFELVRSISGDVNYWGATEITWAFVGDVGVWTGAFELTTDNEDAPLVLVPFTLVADGEGGGEDVGGEDTGAGEDAGGDVGTPDAGGDAGTPDAGGQDTGGSDTGAPDTGGADAPVADTGGGEDNESGGGGGGCAAAGHPAGAGGPLTALSLLALGVALRRRRASRPAGRAGHRSA